MKVTLFGKPVCVHCDAAKNYLADKKIEYEYVDVSTDLGFETLMALDDQIQSVPVISVQQNNEINNIVGFNADKYDEILL